LDNDAAERRITLASAFHPKQTLGAYVRFQPIADTSILAILRPMERRDYTAEAEALFRRFADRHGLKYYVETGVPMEVCWTFPEQAKLSQSLTLGLQNSDELNFGVSGFWSYLFPFEAIADKFERILDGWVAGDARVAITGFRSRLLQVREGGRWKTVYGANGCLFPFRWTPFGFVTNEPG
jgi:hypothetical protein